MEKLTQNINIRTNLNIKKRLMDEASSLDMNMSEYVLLILQSHWDKKDQSLATTHQESTLSSQHQLSESELIISQLIAEKSELQEKLQAQNKSVWQEAMSTAKKLSEERIRREREAAIYEYQRSGGATIESATITSLQARLAAYETDLLKQVFNVVRQNPKVSDLPDVVQILTYQYFQQFIKPSIHD